MNVLSLFDGLSGARIALERANVNVTNYYASEIDKYAIQVSNANYPDIIRLGDINNWQQWNLPNIDLLIGGSPCQSFSFAGKQLNFDDPRGQLFFKYVEILKHYKPKYFVLENVRMKKEYQNIISNLLEVEPIMINSSLLSSQNRVRLYWTNIPNIEQPKDKNIYLKDILETDETEQQRIFIGGRMVGRKLINGKRADYSDVKANQRIELRADNKSNCLTTVQKDSLCIQIGEADIKGYDCIKRVYDIKGKSPTLTTMEGGHRQPKISTDNITWRKLTPLECERLQTLPDNVFYGIIELKELLCLDQAKNFVNAVEKNHKLLKLVLSAERKELREYVSNVIENMNVNPLLIKSTVQENVDMQIQKQTKKCTKNNPEEKFTIVDNAVNNVMLKHQELEENFVIVNVLINLTEGRIIHNGKVESLLKDKNFQNQKNGRIAQNLYLKEITQLVENVHLKIKTSKEKNFTYTMLYHLDINNIEQILIILYCFAKNAIDGCIATKIQIENLYLSLTNGYTNHNISNSQRYKMKWLQCKLMEMNKSN